MKDFIDGCAVIFGLLLLFVGGFVFVEGVLRPWCLRYIAKCEEERIKGGHRRPLDRGDDGTA